MSEPPMPTIAGMLSSIGPDAAAMRLRAERHGALECRGRVPHAERHGAHGRPMRLRELLGERIRLGIDDEVDVALGMQRDVLAAMTGDHRESPAARTGCAAAAGSGAVYSTNSKPSVPMGFRVWSQKWQPSLASGREIDLVSIVTNDARATKLHLGEFSALPAVGACPTP